MEKIPNAIYTKEFREEAVKLVIEQGLSIPEVGQRLSIPKSTLSYWVKACRAGKLSVVGNSKKTLNKTELELATVKRELAQLSSEQRTLPGSHRKVRTDESTAIPVYNSFYVPYAEGITKRLLCMV